MEEKTQGTPKSRQPIKADLKRVKRGRVLADNLISLQPGDSIIVKMMGCAKQLGGGEQRWGRNGPPTVLPVEVHPTNQPALLILQTILESKFEVLGEEGLGHHYLIEAGDTVPGKAYRAFDVTEVNVDA